jgi:probable O-glycosylation ligase (exosortase A-associated)
MRSFALIAFYMFFLVTGTCAAFVLALGYIWVDLFSPQQVAYSIINQIPVSMIIGAAAISGYMLFDRRDAPRFVLGLWLIVIWAVWITLTTTWAAVPVPAWEKWNWAIKTVVFAAFLPFVIRSRVQIEAMILTIILSLSGTIIAAGFETMMTGGGYQRSLGLIAGNSGLAEGSTLATVSIAIIPLILYARKHTLIIPRHRLVDWFCYALIASAVLTAFGTFERTGIVAMATLGLFLWARSKHKVLLGSVGLAAALVGLTAMSGDWFSRMSTISDFRVEESALTRIAVWMWTLQYAAAHPFGGGFSAYLLDTFRVPIEGTGEFLEIKARAFHSIYFEVLGEQGIVGFGIFSSMIACMFVYLRSVQRACRAVPADAWLYELARALTISAAVYLAGGAFVGIAFQPLFYYWFAAAICLNQYVARAKSPIAMRAGAIETTGLGPLPIAPNW